MAAPANKTLQNMSGAWTLNRELSDDFDPGLKIQGVSYLLRRAAGWMTIHMRIKQEDTREITAQQQMTSMRFAGTNEIYVLDWEWRHFKDPVYGDCEGRSRWITREEAVKEGVEAAWIEGDSEGMVLQTEGKTVSESWSGRTYWQFETVDGERRYTRRSKIWNQQGEEAVMRIVYNYLGE